MALERRNPLPPGVYWVDVFGENRTPFSIWTTEYPQVIVLKTVSYPASSMGGYPARDWYLFRVSEPVRWPSLAGLGFPTIAEKQDQTEPEDTAQRPEPEPDPLQDFGKGTLWSFGAGGSLGFGLGIASTLGLLWLASKIRR